MKYRIGDWVAVRSPEEILATLDANGTVEGLPFMPEMVNFCGKAFKVQRHVAQTCIDNASTRRFPEDDVLILNALRCDGEGHDGCRRGCRIFWKEAWLRPALAQDVPTPINASERDLLMRRLKTKVDEERYFCQSTQLHNATERFPPRKLWAVRIPVTYLRNGDLSYLQLASLCGRWLHQRTLRAFGADKWLKGKLTKTPSQALDLQPGEKVRIKSREEIVETLDTKGRNRAMVVCAEMLRACGSEAEVRFRVDRIINESTGKMRDLSATVTLKNISRRHSLGEECACYGVLGDCPRGELM
jgi:hypothetical protein